MYIDRIRIDWDYGVVITRLVQEDRGVGQVTGSLSDSVLASHAK